MKNKKYLAIALSISIIASSFSGIIINADKKDNIDYITSKAPEPDYIVLEPELKKEKIENSKINIETSKPIEFKNPLNLHIKTNKNTSGKNLKGISDSLASALESNGDSSADNEGNIFKLNAKEIENYMEKGYSMQDIFEADELGDKIVEEPKKLLDQKAESKDSVVEIAEGIMSDKKETAITDLKNKYKDEYSKLSEQNFKDNEIVSLLMYIDVNSLKLTNDLITKYKNEGEELFQSVAIDKLSDKYKKKYNISNSDAKYFNDNLIRCYEDISKNSKLTVKQLIEDYVKQNKN
jgi:hypothetical protein